MFLFGDFHDACLREIHVSTGHYVEENLSMHVDWRTTVHMLVQRQFRNPSGLHVSPPPQNCDAIIFHTVFFLRERVWYWAERGDWPPETSDYGETTWVVARKVYWRGASTWLGLRPMYRTSVE